jgi:TFIIH basal transcription factor complex TTD-A subunit
MAACLIKSPSSTSHLSSLSSSRFNPFPNSLFNTHIELWLRQLKVAQLACDWAFGTNGTAGVLVQCDESIMAIILKIDAETKPGYIMERLDDETCLVQASKLNELKTRLNEVCAPLCHQLQLTAMPVAQGYHQRGGRFGIRLIALI